MLQHISDLQGAAIQASDGAIGHADQFLFDDQHWTVRYLVIDTGGWLSGRRVLVSPIALGGAAWDAQQIGVRLTRQQVEQAPGIDTDQPVSRQYEQTLADYYGYQPYWGGAGVWGAGMYPAPLAYGSLAPVPSMPVIRPMQAAVLDNQPLSQAEHGDPHVRSTREVIGYAIHASDGDLGHVEDFLVDDETWTLRYVVVDTKNWWPGKKVLVSVALIAEIRWPDASVQVNLPRDTIKHAPSFDSGTPLSRTDEARLHAYYQRSAAS